MIAEESSAVTVLVFLKTEFAQWQPFRFENKKTVVAQSFQ